MKTISLKLSEIVTDAGTQIRACIDNKTVEQYAEDMLDATNKFPPATVFHDGNQYILADGFHRVMAAIRNEFKDILADVHKGTHSDALKFALGANARHGLPRTNSDKRRSVVLALTEWPKLSSSELGRLCAVSHQFVEGVRKEIQPVTVTGSTRVGRDGKERKMPPPPPQKKPLPPPPPQKKPLPPPPPPNRQTKPPHPFEPSDVPDACGHPIPHGLLPIWERSQEVQELLSAISKVRGALRDAQETKDILFSEVNFSAALAHLDQAYTDVKSAKPYAVCSCGGMVSKDSCRVCRGRGLISEFKWKTAIPEQTKQIRFKTRE